MDTPINLYHPDRVPWGWVEIGGKKHPVYLDHKQHLLLYSILRRLGGESNYTISTLSDLTATDGGVIIGDGTNFVVESGATARTSLGLGTGDTPQFAGVEIGHASDSTLTRASAGNLAVEGNVIYRAGGTDVPLADGGTGASLSDPGADRILFWDESSNQVEFLTAGTNLTISGTTISAASGAITVEEADGAPSVGSVTTIVFDGATVTDDTGGQVTVTVTGGSGTVYPYTDMDEPPASSHASDMEGTSVTGWTFLSNTGTPTVQSDIIADAFSATTGPSGSNPLYNVNDDIEGMLVMQPTLQGKFVMYRSFAPTTATEWCMACKVRLFPTANASIADDRVMFGVTDDATPVITSNEIADSIAAEFRTNSTSFERASIRPASRTNATGARDGIAYLGLVGRTDNSITVYTSCDGLAWRIHQRITSGTAPAGAGTVATAFLYVQDINNDGQAPVVIVDWIRFKEGDANLVALGGGR